MRILLAAEEAAGVRLLRTLARGAHEVVGVLATPPDGEASGSTAWGLANQLGVACWPARNVRDSGFTPTLAASSPDVLLNVHSLHIIPPAVLEVPRFGAFNLHPGPLPRYAGLNAPSWAIYNGERTHAVTLHKMDAGIDTGPVVSQATFDIAPTDSALTVSLTGVRLGLGLIARLLEDLESNPQGIQLTPTNPGEMQYFRRHVVPFEGKMSWSWSSHEIARFVRACDYFPFRSPWGHPQADLAGEPLGLVKSVVLDERTGAPPGSVIEAEGDSVVVACGDGTLGVSHVLYRGDFALAPEVVNIGTVLGDGVPSLVAG